MKRLVSAIAFLAVFFTVSPRAADGPKFLKSVGVMQMYGENHELRNMCTVGSIRDHYFVTAAHCVEVWMADDTNPFEAAPIDEIDDAPRFVNGALLEVVGHDHTNDLAVVYTPDLKLPALKLGHAVTFGDQLIVAGHPFGLSSIFVTYGHVSNPHARLDGDDTRFYMMFNVAGAPGNSGSPVLDSDGKLVSVLQIGFGGYSPETGGATYDVLKAFIAPFLK